MTTKTTNVTKLSDQGIEEYQVAIEGEPVSGVPLGRIPMIGPFGQGIAQ
jgi:hypothetical protein